jgi:hypothetical protein
MSVITEYPSLDSSRKIIEQLEAIDVVGWDSPQGNQLLAHVRSHLVRPQVFAAGLKGPAAEPADATAWELAWEVLNKSRLREAESPLGVLWTVVRRAIQGEMLAAAYQTSERKSWRAWRQQSPETAPPISLTQLDGSGWEPTAPPAAAAPMGPGLVAVAAALVQVGWERRTAHAVVQAVASTVARDGNRAGIQGWRGLAPLLDLPPWQVRRVAAVLLGGPGWVGAVERMASGGPATLQEADMQAALSATLNKSMPTSVLAGRLSAGNPLGAAS